MSKWITVRQAAEILDVHMSAIPKLSRRGELTPREQRPRLNRAQVEALRTARVTAKVERERRRAAPPAPPARPRPPDDEHVWLRAPAAAAVLGCSVSAIRARAQHGKVPSVVTSRNRWFRLDHLELAVRAQVARTRHQVSR